MLPGYESCLELMESVNGRNLITYGNIFIKTNIVRLGRYHQAYQHSKVSYDRALGTGSHGPLTWK